MLVLRDYDHLLTAATPETVVKTNLSQSLVGHRVAFQVRLSPWQPNRQVGAIIQSRKSLKYRILQDKTSSWSRRQ